MSPLDLLGTDLDWVTDEAVCGSTDPAVFFPGYETRGASRPAITACDACPLQEPCLAYALSHNVLGVWGGTTTKDRTRLRRRGERAA